MVEVTGPEETSDTLLLDPEAVEAVDAAEATEAAEALEAAVGTVIAEIIADANTDAAKYAEETEVPYGGE